MEAPTVGLVGYKTTREEIFTLYQEVYQLKRAPEAVPGDPEEAEKTHHPPGVPGLTEGASLA